MKKSYVFILFVLSLTSYSQTKSGKIIYKKTNNIAQSMERFEAYKTSDPNYYNNVLEIETTTNNLLKVIPFELTFLNGESIFKADRSLEMEGNPKYKFVYGPDGSCIYYRNENNGEHLTEIDAYGEVFLVKNEPQEWLLVNETKKIGDYECFKATTTIKLTSRNGVITTPITAWYSPALSLPFGPVGFGGLPGLIFELNWNNYTYFIETIDVSNTTKVEVSKLTKGIKVTKEEFDKIGIGAMDNFKKSFK